MQSVKITIKEKSDTVPAIDETKYKSVQLAELKDFVILEKGTTSGRTVATIGATDADNNYYLVQMTPNVFESLYMAFKGAQARFGDININYEENPVQHGLQRWYA